MAAEDSSIEDPTYDPSFEKEHGAFVGEKEREREATEEEEAERVEGLEEDDGNKETKDQNVANCTNPYRDRCTTTPPQKTRASYLFFSVGEIMTLLGDTWRNMSEEEQQPYLISTRWRER
mmetsp:Transcript_43760/g.53002  ORF Transcript_43760/g.53002 Transcript_43760/m.53002 type:complete len:120 (+) Transcript_43760:3-362(+)